MKQNIFSRMTLSAWKRDLFGTIIFSCFTAITVMLFSLSILLFSNLTGAIDHLMEMAKTPDFLQMHTGELDPIEIEKFVQERQDVEDWQICRFLNIENSILFLGDKTLKDSTQDNGICVQSKGFDLLLDTENQEPEVEAGTVWVPACYQKKYDVQVGDLFYIGKETLTVAGFIRDSQMNSMMASSKRFLVAESDYERLQGYGSEEYLMEFLLKPQADIGSFQTAYENGNLPGNGPTITRPLIRMMNALSDGIMIFILVLISLMVLLISLVCIRFMLLTKIEDEKKEVGLLKAVGISKKEIRVMFIRRYVFLTGIGTVVGFLASLLVSRPLSEQMRKLYGTGENGNKVLLLSAFGAVVLAGFILLYLFRLLKKLNEMTAIQVLTGQCDTGRKKDGMFCIFLVAAIVVFLMLVPANLYSTMSSERFVTYMGIGNSQIRMDIRQTEDISGKQENLRKLLEQDGRVEKFSMFQTSQIPAQLSDGEMRNLLVEQGNHTIFPVSYSKGKAPVKAGEIALSSLLAQDMNLDVGDTVSLKPGSAYEDYVICGIYSDITNGGKSAKVNSFIPYGSSQDFSHGSSQDLSHGSPKIMWSIVYLTLDPEASQKEWMKDYQMEGVEIADIHDHIEGTYGQTLSQISKLSVMIKLVAVLIMILVIALFLRLLVAKERIQISMKKAMGFVSGGIRNTYLVRAAMYMIPGILVGMVLGNFAGEQLCGMALKSLGADGFRFVMNPWEAVCIIPALALAAGFAAMYIGTREIRNIRPVECLQGRE
ncbi:MAG: ABC transporter permease [Lachnospiraceae bacterium]